MLSNTIKTTMLTTITLFMLQGCGDESCKTEEDSSGVIYDNTAREFNDLGYYGDGVRFGSELIVGHWVALGGTRRFWSFTFDNNGTGNYEDTYEGDPIDIYGISADGTTLYYLDAPLGQTFGDRVKILKKYHSSQLAIVQKALPDFEGYCYYVDHAVPSILQSPTDTYFLCKTDDKPLPY